MLYNNAHKYIFVWRKLSTNYVSKSIGLLSIYCLTLPSAPWSLLIKKHGKQSNEGFEVEIIQLVYTIKEYKLEDSMVFYLHFSFFAY